MSVTLFGGNQLIELKQWTFPAGERGVTILEPELIKKFNNFTITLLYKGQDDLIDLLLLVDACRRISPNVHLRLLVPYFPYSRQDRVASPGDSFSLQVIVNLIKSCDFWEIETWDAHSEVLESLLGPKLSNIPQSTCLFSLLYQYSSADDVAIVAPDTGAMKKIGDLSKLLNLPVIEAKKQRDPSDGKILKTYIGEELFSFDKLIVADDICDGGGTFLALASAIRALGYEGSLILAVTHGIFSRGKEVLYAEYDEVLCVNNFERNNVASYTSNPLSR